ncbi:MAG: helix-turn-helix domain-containing protein [Cellulosilyticum sp.]|jgi:transposase-like protein|nr:helix-turn-helix domain-containing protein [Cellulosilyticum sp.]
MANRRINLQEKLKLINECRQSGLSDYRWCKENNINPSTFYTWISRLRDEACTTVPRAQTSSYPATTSQDVVRVDIISDTQTVIKKTSNSTKHLRTQDIDASIEISIDDINIRVNNNANPLLLTHLIEALKGTSC